MYPFKMASLFSEVFILVTIVLPLNVVSEEAAETMTLVLSKTPGTAETFIQVTHPPSFVDSSKVITLEYTCTKTAVVGVELLLKKHPDQPLRVYRKHWRCDSTHAHRKRRVKLRLDDDIGYRPGYFNRNLYFSFKPVLRAWILNQQIFETLKDRLLHFAHAEAKVSYNVQMTPPYSRPYWRPYKACVLWYWSIIKDITKLNNRVCPYEHEIVKLVEYPAVFNGLHYGIYRQLPTYSDPELERQRKQLFTRPTFTVSMWMYITDYCPARQSQPHFACGILMHVSWNNMYMTPLLMVNSEGFPFIETISSSERKHISVKVHYILPKHQWIRLTYTQSHRTWKLVTEYGGNYNLTLNAEYTYSENMIMDDTEGDFIVGGNDALVPSFVGYVGSATIYRRKALRPKQIPMPSPYHPMFELGLTRREVKCQSFLTWVSQQTDYYERLLEEKRARYECFNIIKEYLEDQKPPQCPVRSSLKPQKSRILNTFIRHSVSQGKQLGDLALESVAADVFTNATAVIEDSLANIQKVMPLLKQAACLGNYDAMNVLSVILNNGLMVKTDELQAQAYLMLAALDKHRLSALALGHKHFNGLDGVPFDKAQAYFYYKYVAGKTRDDREVHSVTDVVTEPVRLTDEALMLQQTDEQGDVFNWLKHQAMAGVSSAQLHLGRAMYWGSQGLRRNVDAAMEVFRMGADQGHPDMMYDYGINIYTGKTPEKNKTKGIEYMKKAAELRNPLAINALGWVAMNQRNYTLAVEYFKRAYKMGNADSAYYLGHMLLEGYHPSEPQDWNKAYAYFQFAARRGHFDAGNLFAYISMKGTGTTTRNLNLAAEWARYIAEMNPAVGNLLRKGLHAYRIGDIPTALFYYLLAADTGFEVASFNLAWLCDENKDGIVTSMAKECAWRHFNLSVQRESHVVDSYALIKMGDYYWYGCQGQRDVTKAADFYVKAAVKGDPHALFNIAIMVKEGEHMSERNLNQLRIPRDARRSNITLLTRLYSRCKESRRTEAYLPCSLALWRIQLVDVWTRYHIWMKLSSMIGVTVVVATTVTALYNHFRTRRVEDDLI